MRCEWHIHARPGERVFINFTQFSTETDYDFVEIRDSSNRSIVLGRFSGSQLPPVVISCNSSVLVTFFSDHMINGLGFSATFESKGKKDILGLIKQ
jgi:cubilin